MKRKKFKFIVFITLILSIIIYKSVKYYIRINEETKIIPLPKVSSYNLEYNIYREFYIIVNPPKDAHELQKLIKKYDNEHDLYEENSQEFEKYKNMYSTDSELLQRQLELYKEHNMKIKDSVMQEITEGKIPYRYVRLFFQETKFLPRDWKPHRESIESHIYDLIASVSSDSGETQKSYGAKVKEDYKFFDFSERDRKVIDELQIKE